ncbi:hypothetical protein Tcan_16110 [Toxocara canis]|uniref:MMS19 nucleotide excision repair protein n=2 Tax=Toxocara canis TaxID=6265 RepID=A0A0B2UU23_TOXCA|nr:hypothetical protein Tcan_16110 [Toxocara canis]
MPISSLVHMLTLFISFAYTTEICEVSEKTIALIMSVFESSDKDRHEILLHAVHCLILLHRERELDDTRIANSLISMMDKLTEADASGLYAESYLYLAEKGIEVVSLGRFLPHMTSVDIGHILETSAHANRTPGCLWNVAVEKLLTSDFRHSIVFLSAQLRSRCEHSPLLASQGMSAISNTLLSEKSPSTDVALKFLVEFFHSFDSETFFPVESMLPLWFCIAMTHIESDDLVRISQFIYSGFRSFIKDKCFSIKDFNSDTPSTNNIAQWIFESLNEISRKNDGWARDAAVRWLEPVVCMLQKAVIKSTMEVCMQSCRIGSHIFQFASHLIYRSPSHCKFNQSLFVRLCKLFIQNTLLVRSFEGSFLDEVVPKYFSGLLALPIASSSYLQRVLVDFVEKFCVDYSLRQKMKTILSEHSRVIPLLYAACKADCAAFSFFTAIA